MQGRIQNETQYQGCMWIKVLFRGGADPSIVSVDLGAVLRGEAIPYSIVSVKKQGLRATYPLENPGSASAYMMLIR